MVDLILDTSTERGLVALAEQGQVLFARDLPLGLQNSQYILPAIREGLHACSLNRNAIGLVATGAGPGSYTGIRVAVSVAKSCAFALSIPLIAFSSLEGFVPFEAGSSFAAVADARIGGVYAQMERGAPQLLGIEEVKLALQQVRYAVTPSAARLQERLGPLACEWVERAPSASHLAQWVHARRATATRDLKVEIRYLRPGVQ